MLYNTICDESELNFNSFYLYSLHASGVLESIKNFKVRNEQLISEQKLNPKRKTTKVTLLHLLYNGNQSVKPQLQKNLYIQQHLESLAGIHTQYAPTNQDLTGMLLFLPTLFQASSKNLQVRMFLFAASKISC